RREARLVDDHRYGVELSLAPTPVKSSQKNRPDAPYEGLPPNRWMPGTNAKYPSTPGRWDTSAQRWQSERDSRADRYPGTFQRANPQFLRESAPMGVCNRLSPITTARLGEDVVDVGLDCGLAHEQLLGDLGVRPTRRDESKHLAFTFRQSVWKSTEAASRQWAYRRVDQ